MDCYCTVRVSCCVFETPLEVAVTVIVDVPAGVPGGFGGVYALPQPVSKAPETRSIASGSNVAHFGMNCGLSWGIRCHAVAG